MLVFSFNTVLGFACSLGLDMGYNKRHHQHDAESFHSAQHHGHSKEGKEHHHSSSSNSSNKDDCCSNGATSFNLLNKTIPHQVEIVPQVYFTDFTFVGFHSGIFPYTNVTKRLKPFVRSHHPPIADIRIAIQSFQI